MAGSATIDDKAAALLARREHSRSELRDKLLQRGYEEDAVDAVLDAFAERGWQSDVRFTEVFVRGRRARGEGPLRIAYALRRRGIDDGLIEESLALPDEVWVEAARHAWRKRFAGERPHDMRQRAQQERFLYHRGFSHDHIKAVFRGLAVEAG